jgi:hypothetical protein
MCNCFSHLAAHVAFGFFYDLDMVNSTRGRAGLRAAFGGSSPMSGARTAKRTIFASAPTPTVSGPMPDYLMNANVRNGLKADTGLHPRSEEQRRSTR